MRRLFSYSATIVFVVLSLGDLVVTWWLLECSGRLVCEGNPIADWWLRHYGWLGLASFKSSMVLLVIVLTALTARKRPQVATRTLRFACAALVMVMLHSVAVGRSAQTANESVDEVNNDLEELNGPARARTAKIVAYFHLLAEATDDVAAGRSTLSHGVDRLANSARAKDGDYLQSLVRRHPGHSFRECLSIEIKWLVFWLPRKAA